MDLREMGCDNVDCIHTVQERDYVGDSVYTVMHFYIP